MNEKCQWCGMELIEGKPFNWKCGTKQNSKGTRIQSDACAEIVQLKLRIKKLEGT